MIALLFTPLGRYIAIGGGILVVLFGVYLKIRADAVEDMKARAQADIIERTKDALDAANSVDLNPERLLDTDGHRRD
jgi:hypothetical protein